LPHPRVVGFQAISCGIKQEYQAIRLIRTVQERAPDDKPPSAPVKHQIFNLPPAF